jgi:hypothetical protein
VMLEVEIETSGNTSSELVIAPPPPATLREPDETMERAPVPAARRDPGSGAWTVSAIAAPPAPAGGDDWVVTNVGNAVRALADADADADADGDDGTPIEGVAAVAPALSVADGTFIAGEIDVPAPPPQDRGRDTPSVDLRGAGSLLGDSVDPDTGSRTPPIERR